MKKTAFILAGLLVGNSAYAIPTFTGQDYSGVYDCTGKDAHEGPYTGIVTMQLDASQSRGGYGAYKFKLEVPGFGIYEGMAVADDDKLAVYFALQDQATRDYGVGIATIKNDDSGKQGFSKFYYEPEYKGGNTGTEECILRK